MFKYQTTIDPNRQVYSPTMGMERLTAKPPLKFSSGAAGQHFADVYRGLGQQAAVTLGRAATDTQNKYGVAAQNAQDQSVLGGLNLLSNQQANQFAQQEAMNAMRARFLNSALGGLM
jgi:hypothetical protein